VELAELLERLCELARELGLEVRELRRGADAEPSPASGICRVRGETWVLLAAADDLERRIDVLARALQSHAGPRLEARYLPPAVRARLARAGPVG
jgi:hypothetical protein